MLTENAWPALRSLLYRLDDAGVDPVDVLRTRAAERDFESDPDDPARSVAQVLHYRVAADLPPLRDGDRLDLLPGWVASPPAGGQSDPEFVELRTWLVERSLRIADRVRILGEQAVAAPPSWASILGKLPDDQVARDSWIRRAGQVAAYRERWHIPDSNPVTLPPCDRGEQGRARAWVAQYLCDNQIPDTLDSRLGTRTTRTRDRLEALRNRMHTTRPEAAFEPDDIGYESETGTSADQGPDIGP